MIVYSEVYIFVGGRYCIEEYEVPPTQCPVTRYRCWAGGCLVCAGGHSTRQEAREHIKEQAIRNCQAEADNLRRQARVYQEVVTALGRDPMQAFREGGEV